MSSTTTAPASTATAATTPAAPSVHLTGASTPPPAPAAAPTERLLAPFKYADLLDHGPYGDFRDALNEDGFVVVPRVMTLERAAELRGDALGWLESFGRGFDRNNPKTFAQEFLPQYYRGGMFPAYGGAHEQWVSRWRAMGWDGWAGD